MKLGTQDKREYVVTRPRLMESLERQGFKGTPTKHPYSEHLRAWAFPLSRELAVFVANTDTNSGIFEGIGVVKSLWKCQGVTSWKT